MRFSEQVERAMSLTPAEMSERLREIELAERNLVAEKAALVAVADAVGAPADDGHASTMGRLVAHTNCSKGDAVKVRKLARVCNHVEEVADAISEARIGVSQAHEFARVFARRGSGSRLAGAADRLVVAAEHLEFDDFRTRVTRWEASVDRDGAELDAATAEAGRDAYVIEADAGVTVRASGGDAIAATEMATIFQHYVEEEFRVDAARAERDHGPGARAAQFARTAEQRRFDALRLIFSDAVVARADLGRSRRLFTKAQREAAALLPTSCSWPGCFVPAELCQTDHLDEWQRDDGATDLANAAPDCRRHNVFKTTNGIRSRPTALGTILHERSDGSSMLPVGASPPPMAPPPSRSPSQARARRRFASALRRSPEWPLGSIDEFPPGAATAQLIEWFAHSVIERAPAAGPSTHPPTR